MINFFDIQAICILIFFLSIIVLCCMAVHYACTRFGTLEFGFHFKLTARESTRNQTSEIRSQPTSDLSPLTSLPTHPQTPSL